MMEEAASALKKHKEQQEMQASGFEPRPRYNLDLLSLDLMPSDLNMGAR